VGHFRGPDKATRFR